MEHSRAMAPNGSENAAGNETMVQRMEGAYLTAPGIFRSGSPVASRLESLVGGSDAATPVLIVGETAAVAAEVAGWVHRRKQGKNARFCRVPCGGFNESTVERWLFGNMNGGSATEWVQDGTLFLENADKLSSRLVEKLSTWARGNNGTAHGRVVISVATESSAQAFASLRPVRVSFGQIGASSSDLLMSARIAAEDAFQRAGKTFPGFSNEAQEELKHHNWSNGLGELLNSVERAAIVSDGRESVTPVALGLVPKANVRAFPGGAKLELVHSAPRAEGETAAPGSSVTPMEGESYTEVKKRWCDAFERDYLMQSLKRHGGNVSSAAREAKLDRSNFLRLLRRHGLKAEDFRAKKSQPMAA